MKPNLIKALLLVLTMSRVPCAEKKQPDENYYRRVAEIPLPPGFIRTRVSEKSFAAWLRNLPLKKDKHIFLYNGQMKTNQLTQFAVIDLPIGSKNLQQCADVVMRLRADYLRSENKWQQIRFFDNDGKLYAPDGLLDNKHWQNWLELVFTHCGTISLEKQLTVINGMDQCRIGTVLIQGGSPGHAMIIIDMAENKEGKKIFLLAQGYMPAQDIHIVINQVDSSLSPWYERDNGQVRTPGWIFPAGSFRNWEATN
jgi:hypothetical protein